MVIIFHGKKNFWKWTPGHIYQSPEGLPLSSSRTQFCWTWCWTQKSTQEQVAVKVLVSKLQNKSRIKVSKHLQTIATASGSMCCHSYWLCISTLIKIEIEVLEDTNPCVISLPWQEHVIFWMCVNPAKKDDIFSIVNIPNIFQALHRTRVRFSSLPETIIFQGGSAQNDQAYTAW